MWDPFCKRLIGFVLLFTFILIPIHPMVKEYLQIPQTFSSIGTSENNEIDEHATTVNSQTISNPFIVT